MLPFGPPRLKQFKEGKGGKLNDSWPRPAKGTTWSNKVGDFSRFEDCRPSLFIMVWG